MDVTSRIWLRVVTGIPGGVLCFISVLLNSCYSCRGRELSLAITLPSLAQKSGRRLWTPTEQFFQVAFTLSVKRKNLFLAAASRTKDLVNLKEHLCLHEPRAWQKVRRYCWHHWEACFPLHTDSVQINLRHWWPGDGTCDEDHLCYSDVSMSLRGSFWG